MRTHSIIDSAGATLHDLLPRDATAAQFSAAQRLYMRAALDVLDLLRNAPDMRAQHRAIDADLRGYARTIGRAVETAR